MKLVSAALAGALVVYAAGTEAQTTAPIPATAPGLVPVAQAPMLKIGTKVPLKLSEELTTKGKQLRVGQHFQLETSEPILVNGVVVVPVGTPATGEITEVRNKGMWGKSGHFSAQVQYVTVSGRQVRMTGTFDEKGTAGGIGATAVSAIVFLPAGFFMTGTSAKLPIGTPVVGFIGEDVPLQMAAVAAPQPIVVPAAAPVTSATDAPKVINASVTTSKK